MLLLFVFFFFKQKTAYEMRISDWSSDVCSSDLVRVDRIDVSEDAEEPSARSYARRSIEVNLFSPSRSDGEASISLYLESDGTVKLYELASDWIWTLRTGGTLFVDELQNGLHPRALAALIQMFRDPTVNRSEEHTSELQSLMRISYAVFCF